MLHGTVTGVPPWDGEEGDTRRVARHHATRHDEAESNARPDEQALQPNLAPYEGMMMMIREMQTHGQYGSAMGATWARRCPRSSGDRKATDTTARMRHQQLWSR